VPISASPFKVHFLEGKTKQKAAPKTSLRFYHPKTKPVYCKMQAMHETQYDNHTWAEPYDKLPSHYLVKTNLEQNTIVNTQQIEVVA
jgi:hypothetical protein